MPYTNENKLFKKTEALIKKYNINKDHVFIIEESVPFSLYWLEENDLDISEENQIKIQKQFKLELEKNILNGKYFFGCNFDIYKQTYTQRLNSYLEKNQDAIEKEFINSELYRGILLFRFPYVDFSTKTKIERSLKRRKEFLEYKLLLLGYRFLYRTEWVEEDAKNFNRDVYEGHELEELPDIIFKNYHKFISGKKTANQEENLIWFKVGILLANGEIDRLNVLYSKNSNKVAEHLKQPTYLKYISGTNNNYKGSNMDKNIYAYKDRMKKIIIYCLENNLKITPEFFNKFNSL